MLEYHLRTTQSQPAAIEAAIRTTQLVRNQALRLWMDTRGTGKNDWPALCAHRAQDVPLAARLTSMAPQAAADRAWFALSRFDDTGQSGKPGKQGSPRFQHENRRGEDQTSGGRVEPDGKQLTFTAGHGSGTLRLIGTRRSETVPLTHITRVRMRCRADGSAVPVAVQADRQIPPHPPGSQVGLDGGLKRFSPDSDGHTRDHPRHRRQAATKRKRLHRSVSRQVTCSQHRKQAIRRLAKGDLNVRRQRQDVAVKAARALIQSSDLGAYEHVQLTSLVKTQRLATRISDARWGLFLSWVRSSGGLHGSPSVAGSPRFTTQDGAGCAERVKTTRAPRTPMCPVCGLGLDRDWNAALTMLFAALAERAAKNRPAGQAGTGSLRAANASGQTPAGGRKRLRSVKVAG